ncbi:MAG: hypothetical protein HFI53_06405 [Lachnospiraceae bacterium]|nr:hypothetical protein [Lachnospiraceae bacterium]
MMKIVEILRKTSEKIIFVCSSPYNILIAVSLIMKANLYGKCGLILPTYSQKNIKYFKEITLKMKQWGIVCEVIDKKNMIQRAVGLSDRENFAVMDSVLISLNTKRHEFFLVNHTWNKALVCYPASLWFRYCKESIFIEEGYAQTATPDEKPFVLWLKYLYGNQKEFWKDSRLKGIYVQNRELFSDYLIPDLKQFTLNVDFSEEEKQELLDLFVSGQDKIEIERLRKEADGILYTQPISEDGYVKEEAKIRIYKELVEYYSKYGKIFIKVHPRDTTQYDFAEEMILTGNYPSELLNILGVKFKFAVGLCTSAVETANAQIKINLNERFLSELKYELREL